MKLNPPASSSDLEIARQIARRLHQHRRRDDQSAASLPAEETPVRPRLTPPPLPPRPALAEPPAPPPPPARRPPSEPAHHPGPSFAPAPTEPSFDLPEAPRFERPSWTEPEPAPLEDLAGPGQPTPFRTHEPKLALEPALPEVDVDVDVGEPPLSPEEMVGESAEASPLEDLTDPESSPLDDVLLAPPPAAEEPAPPSWDAIVETCRGLAQARAAMLVDPAGQVFSSRGDWPPPGPEAIASKLVVMMAKTLKDAPTRSISAPLMGMHLTAWRVPLNEGLVTVAFIGAAPVRADARPAIDGEIHRGAGA
jgi:hypothetical protein